jgi:hypothetical protein
MTTMQLPCEEESTRLATRMNNSESFTSNSSSNQCLNSLEHSHILKECSNNLLVIKIENGECELVSEDVSESLTK